MIPAPTLSPRRFLLYRRRDVTGISGTGVVAEGTQFSDGSIALRWLGDWPATAVWPSLDGVIAVHGHVSASEVQWLDPIPTPPRPSAKVIPPDPGRDAPGLLHRAAQSLRTG